ncbi:MAG: DivIVA domain-containing protein [Deltaproteobacteria bacterium]
MLTPLDIENQKFKKVVWGYSAEEVDEFLDKVIESYESIYKENIELKDKIGVLNEGIQHYKAIEETLKNTLMVAQTTSDDIKKNAYGKGENIIKEAELKAERIIGEANQEASKARHELEEMKKNYNVFKAKMESQLLSQLEIMRNNIEE